ncbi:MAG: bifunctional UDP-N-acetylglucosamine diphosphorylase/glucosamine-1-phosphate N-acetyltransferase GlmU [Gammaproteobacteria bacterium]|nr:bifunctional UDP-N-acetylglucosamine diphosphorylase/glucosamine-1-phosphate N-acetyltransferase GlmU [Gammaproteobacteria bacterium]MCZ6880360.1 bifunctional UDP-N-acetylglucosamine diphosphorylase/glucosamine-1-phosphate N-acetyltransferase GlmU [Gammaproteobacteria bacterium]
MPVDIVILAAGQGTRMKSELPKVLQPLAGRPLLEHVLERSGDLGAEAIHVVYGYGGHQVPQALADWPVNWILQEQQLGTGHAVTQAMPGIADNSLVLILYGDVPLISEATLTELLEKADSGSLALLSVMLADPTGYGRIIRNDQGQVRKIVEQEEANETELTVCEVNTGILACPARHLRNWLEKLGNDNSQGEYYLTDVIAMAVADRYPVDILIAKREIEVMGVNDKQQLAELESANRAEKTAGLMRNGVTLLDPARVDVRGKLSCGRDVVIDINAIFEGDVELGDGVSIGPNVIIRNSKLGAGCKVHANTVIEDAEIGESCELGPFARVRPGTVLEASAKLGNFVEVKKSHIGKGSKVNHLSYIGDTEIGERVNVGAGTITCNYDGANKFKTIIEDDVFIGSGVELVAPLTLEKGATIGAGSTICQSAPANELTVARSRQTIVKGWKSPRKKARE